MVGGGGGGTEVNSPSEFFKADFWAFLFVFSLSQVNLAFGAKNFVQVNWSVEESRSHYREKSTY